MGFIGKFSQWRSSWGTHFEARKWMSFDLMGFLCGSLSLIMHVAALMVIKTHLTYESTTASAAFHLAYAPIAMLALVSFYFAATTNPGAVPLGARPLPSVSEADICRVLAAAPVAHRSKLDTALRRKRSIRRCEHCNNNFQPTKAKHDPITDRCIVQLDHYCPWICNAVGTLNRKFFVLYLLYSCLTALLSLIMIASRMMHCVDDTVLPGTASADDDGVMINLGLDDVLTFEEGQAAERDDDAVGTVGFDNADPYYLYPECHNLFTLPVVLLFVLSLTFLVLAGCVLASEIATIGNYAGKTTRMVTITNDEGQQTITQVTTEYHEFFGGTSGTFAWHWLIPMPVQYPAGMKQVVLGYKWEPDFALEAFEEDQPPPTEQPCNSLDCHVAVRATSNTSTLSASTLSTDDSEESLEGVRQTSFSSMMTQDLDSPWKGQEEEKEEGVEIV